MPGSDVISRVPLPLLQSLTLNVFIQNKLHIFHFAVTLR